jgi:hypothetical protein
MKPKAWSHTALDNFENCPKQYYEVKVEQRWPFSSTAEMEWGKSVHRAFEHYLLYGTPMSADLDMHRDFLDRFKAEPGEIKGEERIALNTALQPCGYFDKAPKPEVWYRGQVDAQKRDKVSGISHILDHKTGRVKNDFTQLKSFAMWEFIAHPEIHTVNVEFYWTQIRGAAGETYRREQLPEILSFFAAKLHRYADAFLTGVFPAKQSGLCNGWCPVTDCEFWRPKRAKP